MQKTIFFIDSKKECIFAFQRDSIMQAFIPAAGLGTRLFPFTEHRPKALVEVDGVPLLKIAIDNLTRQGISRIVVNVYHFADMICDYITNRSWNAEVIISDERNQLLDTGGGLKKAASLFSNTEPILIHNVDVLSRIQFSDLYQNHKSENNFVTLAVCKRSTSRYLLFNQVRQLIGWSNQKSGEIKWVFSEDPQFEQLAFSGIAVVEPQTLELMPPCDRPYPIVPVYLDIAKNHRISYFQHRPQDWLDVGTPDRLLQAQQWFHS